MQAQSSQRARDRDGSAQLPRASSRLGESHATGLRCVAATMDSAQTKSRSLVALQSHTVATNTWSWHPIELRTLHLQMQKRG